jgi:hypothetical protein
MIVYTLVMASGIFGLALQQFLPLRMRLYGPHEVPLGQLGRLCEIWLRQWDARIDQTCGPPPEKLPPPGKDFAMELRRFYEQKARPFLQPPYNRGAVLLDPTRCQHELEDLAALPAITAKQKDLLTELKQTCAQRREAARLQRYHAWLHGWLLMHGPLSAALGVLSVAHVVTALLY